jgi:hypothetical protein
MAELQYVSRNPPHMPKTTHIEQNRVKTGDMPQTSRTDPCSADADATIAKTWIFCMRRCIKGIAKSESITPQLIMLLMSPSFVPESEKAATISFATVFVRDITSEYAKIAANTAAVITLA